MAPVLLDQRSLFRAGIAVSFTMLVVFLTGYYTGYQKAGSGKVMELNKTIALALPRPAHAETTQFEPHTPQVQIPGANIDVDSPENEADANVIGQQAVTTAHLAETDVETAINQTTALIGKSATVNTSVGQDKQKLQLASLSISPGVFKQGAETADPGNNAVDVIQADNSPEIAGHEGIIDTASAEDARYTIQVGVFADANNALRRMSELASNNLSAYTNGYTSKRNELRFNVRFGYFKDKSSAVAALNKFEHNMSGSGYVARIRRN